MVDGILAPEPEYFCVSVRIKPTNNIKIFIDGDQGITIEKCVRFKVLAPQQPPARDDLLRAPDQLCPSSSGCVSCIRRRRGR